MRESNSHSSTSGKSCLLKVLLALALLGGVSILIVAIIFSRWKDSVAQELEAYKQDARAQGYPVTLEELDAWYPAVPDDQNAATMYEQAFASLEATDPELARISELYAQREAEFADSDFSAELTAQVADYLVAQNESLAELEAASYCKEARFPVDYTDGMAADLSHLTPMRWSARLLVLSADQALEQGDTERAIERYVQVLAIARASVNEPSVLAQIVRVSVDSIACAEIARALSRSVFDSSQLAALDTAWTEAHNLDGFTRAMAADRCVTTSQVEDMFTRTQAEFGPSLLKMKPTWRYFPVGIRRAYINLLELKLYRAFASVITPGEPDWPGLFKDPQLKDHFEDKWTPLTTLLMPPLRRSYRTFIRDEACFRVVRTALAVERYRLDHGVLPDTLEACVPEYVPAEVILDPYNGEPLKFRPEEDGGFQVYSVFENLKDDGGERWEKQGPDSFSGDWVFTVTRSEEGIAAANGESASTPQRRT